MSPASTQPSVVDEETFSVRRTVRISAGVDAVWSAITEPEHVSRWFGVVHLESGGVGASGTITWPERAPVPIRVEAVDPPRSITYRWANIEPPPGELGDDGSTVFTFTLEPLEDGGTGLTVVETGFETLPEPLPELHDHAEGWNGELDKLVALLGAGR